MAQQNHYLLFIDNTPVANEVRDYFAKFNLDIVEQTTITSINIERGMPAAILINWSFLNEKPELIHYFYKNYLLPLLIITDTLDEKTRILMLETGADDCVSKPLYARELHARINAISRRITHSQKKIMPSKKVLLFNEWKLYPASRRIFGKNNKELQLSSKEYNLLFAFVQQPQQVLSREFLLQTTKSSNLNPFDRRIDVQISRLRQKIELDAKKPTLIKTIRNGGYMFTAQIISLKERDLN